MFIRLIAASALAFFAVPALAQTYVIDPGHTYPSFEADHRGLSLWRGKFNKSSGKVVLDRVAKTGTVEIAIDPASIDFGHEKMNEHARGPEMFHVDRFPVITYVGKSMTFEGDKPATVEGDLTMMGVTKPVSLKINRFVCDMHPMLKREVCGADVTGTFNRADFGMTIGLPKFSPQVNLIIQVEAVKAD